MNSEPSVSPLSPIQAKQPTVLVYGMSHTVALANALSDEERTRFEVVQVQGNSAKEGADLLAPVRDQLQDRSPDWVVFLIGGNAHNTLSLFEHEQPFGLAGISSPQAAGRDRNFIPISVLRSLFRQKSETMSDLAGQVLAQYPSAGRIFLSPPPPVSSEAAQADRKGSAFAGIDTEIGEPALRRFVFEIFQDSYRAVAKRLGGRFVDIPASACDCDHLLATRYCRGLTHGNVLYGRLVLDQLADILAGTDHDR